MTSLTCNEHTKIPLNVVHASHCKHRNASKNSSGINYLLFPWHIIPVSQCAGTRLTDDIMAQKIQEAFK